MGAAWREVKDGPAFDSVLEMVRGRARAGHGGLRDAGHADRAAGAAGWPRPGLTAYNHNLDTSREYYGSIISTRTYEDRLRTLGNVRARPASPSAAGGIIGMGESVDDRCAMLVTLANLDPHPESVPINALVPVRGHAAGRPRRRSIRSSWCA